MFKNAHAPSFGSFSVSALFIFSMNGPMVCSYSSSLPRIAECRINSETRSKLWPGGRGVGCSAGMKKGDMADKSGLSALYRQCVRRWSRTFQRVDPLRHIERLLRGQSSGLREQARESESEENWGHVDVVDSCS